MATESVKVKLVDLDPQWVGTGGISMNCPCGCGRPLYVSFKNALDGSPAYERGWKREGTTFETLTLHPSIRRMDGCKWHGYITAGVAASVAALKRPAPRPADAVKAELTDWRLIVPAMRELNPTCCWVHLLRDRVGHPECIAMGFKLSAAKQCAPCLSFAAIARVATQAQLFQAAKAVRPPKKK